MLITMRSLIVTTLVSMMIVWAATKRVQLISGGDDKTARIWEPEKGTMVRVLEGHAEAVR
jgi:WD40 repeat protein